MASSSRTAVGVTASETAGTPDAARHHIWGEAEVLSCYSSSGGGSTVSGGSAALALGRRRALPEAVLEHLASSVSMQQDSQSTPGSGSEAGAPRKSGSSSSLSRSMSAPATVKRSGRSGKSAPPAVHSSPGRRRGAGEVPKLPPQQPVDLSDDRNWGDPELHQRGMCKQCLYYNSRSGCINGEDCRFCHLPHPRKNRPRPCKATRIQCKQIASMLDAIGPDPDQAFTVAERLGARSSYMRTILRGRQRQMDAAAAAAAASGAETDTVSPDGPPEPPRCTEEPSMDVARSRSKAGMLSL